jgi:hypothetical protein
MSGSFSSTVAEKRMIEHHQVVWRGIAATVVYTPDFHALPGDDCHHCHIEVMTEPRVPLPITETGYRSLFLPGGQVEDAGGVAAFVTRWLDAASKSAQWRAAEVTARQGSLF